MTSDDYAEMTRTFTQEGLTVPPVPDRLREEIRKIREWLFATDLPSDARLYHPPPRWEALIESRAREPYFAAGHDGHGINSYVIAYELVYKEVAVYSQTFWGGGYMNNDQQAESVRRTFAKIAELVALAEQRSPAGRTMFVVSSELMATQACGWLAADESANAERWLAEHQTIEPLLDAIKKLKGS